MQPRIHSRATAHSYVQRATQLLIQRMLHNTHVNPTVLYTAWHLMIKFDCTETQPNPITSKLRFHTHAHHTTTLTARTKTVSLVLSFASNQTQTTNYISSIGPSPGWSCSRTKHPQEASEFVHSDTADPPPGHTFNTPVPPSHRIPFWLSFIYSTEPNTRLRGLWEYNRSTNRASLHTCFPSFTHTA